MGSRKKNKNEKNEKMKPKKRNKFEKSKNSTTNHVPKLLLKSGLKNKKIPLRERLKEQLKASHFR